MFKGKIGWCASFFPRNSYSEIIFDKYSILKTLPINRATGENCSISLKGNTQLIYKVELVVLIK